MRKRLSLRRVSWWEVAVALVVLPLLFAACAKREETPGTPPSARQLEQAAEETQAQAPVQEETPPEAPAEPEALAPAPEVGHPAPDISFVSLDGGKHRLSDFAGKPVFLNLFATWCPPCRMEMPSMQKLYEQAGPKGLVMLAVSAEDTDVVKRFIEDAGFTFMVGIDPDRSVMSTYRVRAIPATYLVDRHGTIVYKHVGYADWTSGEAARQVMALLGE